VLGEELRNKLFAAVYMLRSDVNQSVWKSVVQSQARTLRTILDTLMGTLISCLSSPSPEKQAVAGKSMGEMVAKLGDRVLYDVIPILQKGLASDEELLRAGVCLGLSEVIGSCQRNQLTTHMEDLVSTVRRGLCDSAPSVRGAAAQAFDALYKAIQQRAIEEVVPSLLNALQVASLTS
ncbi:armadillo-type protein, partial [Baffinella frigidus]